MPKSFASSLLLRKGAFGACCLIALSLLATGCGGTSTKAADYTVADVQAAFAAGGISLYGRGGFRQGSGQGRNPGFRQGFGQDFLPNTRRALTPAPTPSRPEAAQPLTALLKGVRDAFLVPTFQRERSLTMLRGRFMFVYVYPGADQAKRSADSYDDILVAQRILDVPIEFGYFRKANVVVRYTIFNSSSRIPGYLGRWDSPQKIARQTKQTVTAALGRLG